MRISLYADIAAGVARVLRFQAWGCPHVIAAAEAFCATYEGRPCRDMLEFSAIRPYAKSLCTRGEDRTYTGA